MANIEKNYEEALLEKLDVILFWLKMANIENTKLYFEGILDTDQKQHAYQLSNGVNTIRNIMKETGVKSTSTISAWWSDWMAKGIVRESTKYPDRKEKIFDLSEVGF